MAQPNENSYKKINWSELSTLLTGNPTAIRFNNNRVVIPRKYWRAIDDMLYKEIPTFWYEYKLSDRAERKKKADANRRRLGTKYRPKKKVTKFEKKIKLQATDVNNIILR